MQHKHFTDMRLLALVAGVTLALGAGQTRADTPLSLTVSQTLTYESNVLRDNARKYRDLVSTTGAKIDFNKDYGRQNYRASLLGSLNRYKNTKGYDNDGFNVSLGFSTTLADDWFMSLSHNQVRQLQPFTDQGLTRNKEITDSASSSLYLQYGGAKKISPTFAFTHSKTTYDVFDFQDKSSNYARLGLRYSPSDLLYFEGGVARADTDSPKLGVLRGFVLGDPVKRTDVDISSRWVVTGFSRLNTRLAWTDEKHANDPLRDYKGLTWRATWGFTPAGKVSYSITADRDTNNAGGADNLNFTTRQNKVTTSLAGAANWSITSKISANASVAWKRYQEDLDEANFQGVPTQSRRDKARYLGMGLGLTYAPTRHSSLSCELNVYDRTQSVFSRAYDGESVECTAAIMIDP